MKPLTTEQFETLKLALKSEEHYPEDNWAKTFHNDIINKCIETIERYR